MNAKFLVELALFLVRAVERRAKAHEGNNLNSELSAGLGKATAQLNSVLAGGGEELSVVTVQAQDFIL